MAASGNKLTVITPRDREIVMTRVFDAPRDLVFEAHSSCEHMSNWLGSEEIRGQQLRDGLLAGRPVAVRAPRSRR